MGSQRVRHGLRNFHVPVFLPGKSHGQRSLVGYSPWGRKESDTTERLHFQGLQVDRETCEEKGRGAGTSPEARVHPPHPPPQYCKREWGWGSAWQPQANPAPDGPLGLAGKSTLAFRTKADTESSRLNEGPSLSSTPPPPQQPSPCPSSAPPGPTGSHAPPPPAAVVPTSLQAQPASTPLPQGLLPRSPRSRQLSERFAPR